MGHLNMLSVVAIIVLSAHLIAGQATSKYCKISRRHTMCLFKPGTPGKACTDFQQIRPTEEEKKLIVDIHNELRRKVAKGLEEQGSPGPQPPAANMRELTWDDELARIAKTWANQCTFRHDVERRVVRFSVGQNLFTTYSSEPVTMGNWTQAIHNWYDEVKGVSPKHVASFPPLGSVKKVIGHYSAVVWANTRKVGCGMARFYNSRLPQFPYQIIVVCNYGPAGNIIGYPIYKVGPAGSACPKGTTNKDGLCA